MGARATVGTDRPISIPWRRLAGRLWRVLLAIPLLLVTPGHADDARPLRQPPLELSEVAAPFPLGGHLEVMRDPTGRMSLADALAATYVPVADMPRVAYTTDALWIRFRLRQPETGAGRWFLEIQPGILDHVDFYIATSQAPRGDEDFRRETVGASVPLGDRSIPHSTFLIPFDLPSGALREVYARIASRTAINLRATIFDARTLTTSVSRRSLLYGLMYGAFFLCAFYNLIFFLWLRNRFYLLYAGYVLSLLVSHLGMTGTLVEVLPAALDPTSKAWVMVSGFGLITCSNLFVVEFLQLRERMRWAANVFYAVAALPIYYTTVLLVAGLQTATETTRPIGLCSAMLMLGVSVHLAWKGDPQARRFLIAFAPAVVGAITNTLRVFGVVPNGWASEQVYYLAGLAHVVLMNLSIMTRIRDAENARHEAQAAALVASQVAEERAQRIIEEQTRKLVLANQDIEAALAAERQAVRDQLQFIDMIAHEYRTPMSVIRAGLDVMELRAGSGDGAQTTLIGRMRRSVDRLVEVIEVGLRRERIDQPGLAVDRRAVDLVQLARDIAEETIAGGTRVAFLANGPVLVNADLPLLRTVIINLLENARKYAPRDGTVRILVDSDDGWGVLRVADEGSGVPPADRDRIFDKFYRGARARGVAGVGVGLFLARKIATLHGGTLDLEEADPGCCVFRLRIPVA